MIEASVTGEATVDVVRGLVRETLALPPEVEVRAGQLLFYDLGFTSMDLLDLLFRAEERFGVAIPEGTLLRLAQGELAEGDFARDGQLTPLGRERLMALMHDSPPAVFPERIHVSTLPRYCTVAAVARLVDARLLERG